MQGSSPAGRWEEIKAGVKEEVSAHQERRQAPVLSGAEPHCLSGPGSALRRPRPAGQKCLLAARGGQHTGPSGHRSLLCGRQQPFPWDVLDSAFIGSCLSDCLFPW